MAVTACTSVGGPSARTTEPLTETIQAAGRQALECRSTVAAKPGYRAIAAHFPLSDLNQATLEQMASLAPATKEEIGILAAWRGDIQLCRDQIVASLQSTDAEYTPMVLDAWNKDDETLVLLVNGKLAWGKAVLQLKAHMIEMLANITDRAYRNAAALNKSRDVVLDRRLATLTKLLVLVP
jgi:hypothetical protein